MTAPRSAGFAGVERRALLATPCQRAPFRHAFLARLMEALEEEISAGLLRSQAKRIFERVSAIWGREERCPPTWTLEPWSTPPVLVDS